MLDISNRIAVWLIAILFVIHRTTHTIADDTPDFQKTISPILIRNCLECHQGSEPSGGLDLSSDESLARGGDSGRVIATRPSEESLLWEKVSEGEMPPEGELSEQELAALSSWVHSGAHWKGPPLDLFQLTTDRRAGYDWWSLQPLQNPEIPKVDANINHPIDAFVVARLRKAGLTMSARADAATLVRRLSVRLHGVHPTPSQVGRLQRSDSPATWAAMVDLFLGSYRYGERWARHWLDVARFGESQGFERDRMRPHAWRYRDWVIASLNRDLPYDRFARMQIAGDCIEDAGADGIIATGFLVAGGWDEVGQSQRSAAMKAIVRQDEMEDYVGTVGQTFLGLTTNCARCHDHKFDPIRQVEYFALSAALAGVKPGDRELKVSASQKSKTLVYAVAPAQPAAPTRVLIRGNPKIPGDVVAANGLSAIQGPKWDFGLLPDAPEADRRLKLAKWISSSQNPLFARVIVNRLWQHHFGVGLVSTPNDFGFTGGRPSHPLLLDFLAARLIESGWSLKTIHRLIVTSRTWQQATMDNARAEKVDDENRLLWRGNRTRLDAETLRDSILQVAGQLNCRVGGPSFQDFKTFKFNSQFYEMLDPVGAPFNRRTIYRMVIRSGRNRMLDAFDCPDPSVAAPKRSVTTTPLQSLSLMNHSFVLRMSDALAQRIEHEIGDEIAARVDRAAELVWCRTLAADERQDYVEFSRRHGLAALCRVFINSNEFLYVD